MGNRRNFNPLTKKHSEQLTVGIGFSNSDPVVRRSFENYRDEKVKPKPARGLRSDVITEHGKFRPSSRPTFLCSLLLQDRSARPSTSTPVGVLIASPSTTSAATAAAPPPLKPGVLLTTRVVFAPDGAQPRPVQTPVMLMPAPTVSAMDVNAPTDETPPAAPVAKAALSSAAGRTPLRRELFVPTHQTTLADLLRCDVLEEDEADDPTFTQRKRSREAPVEGATTSAYWDALSTKCMCTRGEDECGEEAVLGGCLELYSMEEGTRREVLQDPAAC